MNLQRIFPVVVLLGLMMVFALMANEPAYAAPLATIRNCDEAGLDAALAAGGTNTFSCPGATTLTVSATKTVSKDTILDGGSLLTISGGDAWQIFTVNISVTATFQNVTLAKGNGGVGGGIYNKGTLTVTNSTLSGNKGVYGGGINNDGTMTVINSTFLGNSADAPSLGGAGGGIYNNMNGILTLINSTFSGNSGFNSAGGGISNGGTLTVMNSTFSGNSVAGLYSLGGGIYSYFGTVTISNSTFSGNGAANGAGGIYSGDGTLNLVNTIIANSTNGDCVLGQGTIGTAKNNLIKNTGASACGLTNSTNGNLIGSDPNLGALGNNGGATQTMALASNSPAINAANPANCPTYDQRGYTRVGTCDIGAYEYGGKIPTITTLTGSSGNFAGAQSFIFTATVKDVNAPVSAPVKGKTPSQTGTVTFYDNNVAIPGCTNIALVGGVATCTAAIQPGTHTITAVYNGDTFYATSMSNALAMTITLAAAPKEVPEGDTLLLLGGGLGGLVTWVRWQWRKRKKVE